MNISHKHSDTYKTAGRRSTVDVREGQDLDDMKICFVGMQESEMSIAWKNMKKQKNQFHFSMQLLQDESKNWTVRQNSTWLGASDRSGQFVLTTWWDK